MGAKRKQEGPRRRHPISILAKPNAVALRGLQMAIAALTEGPGICPEDALAEQARFRAEEEARRKGQGCLQLGPNA